MFDDSEAALDALLARAAWETSDEQMAERLKALVLGEAEVEQPVEETPTATWAAGSCENASHGPEARVTEMPLDVKPQKFLRQHRAIPFFVAMAACLVLAIG